MNTANKHHESLLDRILPFFLIIALTAASIYIHEEIGVLSVFIITLMIFFLRKYDYRLLVGMGIFLLILSAITLVWRGEANADQIAISAFYFLAIGIVGMLLDFMRSRQKYDKL